MLRTGMLALAAGIGLAALIPLGGDQVAHWVMLPALTTWWLCRRLVWPAPEWNRSWVRVVLSVLLCVLLGASYALWRGHLYSERLLPLAWEGHDLWVWGAVSGLPRNHERYRQIDFHVQSSCLALLPDRCPGQSAGFEPRLIRLSIYDRTLDLLPGEQWWLRVRLRRPRSTVNPHITDREAQWFREGVAATGYVRETAFNHATGRVRLSIDRWRHTLLQRLRLPERYSEQQGLLNALVAGDRGGISDRQWQLFADTGTSHLVVISGLHVGFVAWTAYALVSRMARRFPSLLARQPAAFWGGGAAMGAATAYAALAGFSLPTRRALVMLLVLLSGRLAGRLYPASLGFCTALLLVLVMDPLAMASAGFWYSFMAVAALLLAFAGRERRATRAGGSLAYLWARWGRAQWVVFIGLLVPMMIWHGSASPVSPLANALAIPFVSLVIVPLSLGAAAVAVVWPAAAWWLLLPAARCLEWLERGLMLLRDGAGELVTVPLPVLQSAATVCVVLASLLLLMPHGWPLRRMAVPLMLPLLLPRQDVMTPGTARVLVTDVGQGLGVIIRTRHHTVVYDSGPGPVLMGRMLEHQLRAAGQERVHTVVISHGHADHAGGLAGIDGQVDVNQWLTGSLRDLPGFGACKAGRQWRLDGVTFRFLHPPAPHRPDAGGLGENDRSCVLHVRAGADTLLLPGDIEASVEQRLTARHSSALQADILLMPHHGSGSSSTGAFIEAVNPSLAIHSASANNRFGHPDPEVLGRYRQRGVRMLGTAQSGAIGLCLGRGCPADPVMQQYRVGRPRYWRHP